MASYPLFCIIIALTPLSEPRNVQGPASGSSLLRKTTSWLSHSCPNSFPPDTERK